MPVFVRLIIAVYSFLLAVSTSALPLGKTHAIPAKDILHQRDPLLSINTSSNIMLGQLAYMVNVLPIGPPRPPAYDLVLRSTGGKTGKKTETIYPLVTDDENLLFEETWSPDGNFLLMKEGDAYDYTSKYRLYFWNFREKRIQAGPEQYLSDPVVAWSQSSKFISYIQGGDINGIEAHGAGPLRLYTFDLQKQRSHFIVQNPAVGSHAWTKQGSLLCTLLTPFDSKHPSTDTQRQNIYEIPSEGGKPVKIIDHGTDPQPSPDGRWIVFYGWPDAQIQAERQKKAIANHFALSYLPRMYLFDRHTGKRILLRETQPNTFPDNAAWSSDSKTLYMIWDEYKSTLPPLMSTSDQKVYSGQGTGHIYVIHMPQLTKREVAVLTAVDRNSRIDTTGQFTIKGISADGSHLFIQISQIGNRLLSPPFYDYFLEMDAIGLKSKTRQVVWSTKNAEAIDWHLSH